MSPGLKSLLLNAGMACTIVLGTLAAYDRVVVRPAQLIGVVDVAEVYRQKEAEFTLILTKAVSDDDRQKAMLLARRFSQRLPAALDELPRYLDETPLYREANRRFLGMEPNALASWLVTELERAGVARRAERWLDIC